MEIANANSVHVENAATKPKSKFTASGLEQKMIKSSYAQFKGLVDTVKSMHIAQTHFSQAGQRNSYREIKVFDGNRRESSSNFWEHCHTC